MPRKSIPDIGAYTSNKLLAPFRKEHEAEVEAVKEKNRIKDAAMREEEIKELERKTAIREAKIMEAKDEGLAEGEELPPEAFQPSKGIVMNMNNPLTKEIVQNSPNASAATDALRNLFQPTSTNETQARAELMKTLFDKRNIKMVTDIQPYEMAAIMSMSAISGTLPASGVLDNFIKNFEQYKVSYMRKGRQEGLVIATPPQPQMGMGGQMGFMNGLRNSIFPSGEQP
jgi:hypothetical protein